MSQNVPATVVTTVRKPSLLPRFVGNIIEAANELSEALLIGATGVKKATAGVDEVCTLMLSQQRQRLLKELTEA